MTDRAPLEQSIDKDPELTTYEDSRMDTGGNESIDEMQDMNMLSVILGFENGFDGENAEGVYAWAKENTGEEGGPKVLKYIKDTITKMGVTEKGKLLLRKLSLYASLDSKQKNIQRQKELL